MYDNLVKLVQLTITVDSILATNCGNYYLDMYNHKRKVYINMVESNLYQELVCGGEMSEIKYTRSKVGGHRMITQILDNSRSQEGSIRREGQGVLK